MAELLNVERLTAGYGEAVVLTDISFKIAEGQALALLGRNGMGKTTLVNSIVGVTRHIGGTISLDGRDITSLRPDQRAHAGVGWVPQERNIFRSLTVEENMTAIEQPGPWTLAKVYNLFPRLAERRRNLGNELSGGEQQMLAVARGLASSPKLLMLDEPSMGLAPTIADAIFERVQEVHRGDGLTILLVEQRAAEALESCDRGYLLDTGRVVLEGPRQTLLADARVKAAYLGM